MRLIDKDTPPVPVRFGACTFQVKALSHERLTQLRELHLAAGQKDKDSVPFRRACMAEALVGWSGLTTGAGEPVPFDPARAGEIGVKIPDRASLRILDVIQTDADEVAAAAGN